MALRTKLYCRLTDTTLPDWKTTKCKTFCFPQRTSTGIIWDGWQKNKGQGRDQGLSEKQSHRKRNISTDCSRVQDSAYYLWFSRSDWLWRAVFTGAHISDSFRQSQYGKIKFPQIQLLYYQGTGFLDCAHCKLPNKTSSHLLSHFFHKKEKGNPEVSSVMWDSFCISQLFIADSQSVGRPKLGLASCPVKYRQSKYRVTWSTNKCQSN